MKQLNIRCLDAVDSVLISKTLILIKRCDRINGELLSLINKSLITSLIIIFNEKTNKIQYKYDINQKNNKNFQYKKNF